MKTEHRLAICLCVAWTLAAAGCGTNSAVPPVPHSGPVIPPVLPTPTPVPQHLYLSQGSVYTLPLTNASMPSLTISTSGLGMAFDPSGRELAVAGTNGIVQVFALPIRWGATPTFTFAAGVAVINDLTFDPAGELLVVGGATRAVYQTRCFFFHCVRIRIGTDWLDQISVFSAPITASSTPNGTFTIGTFFNLSRYLAGAAMDGSGNLWTADGAMLYEYAPPFGTLGSPTVSIPEAGAGIAFFAGNMYVATSNGVDVFQPPFGSTMKAAFTISAPAASHLAFDRAGDLYVTTTTGSLLVFNKPLTAGSLAVVTLSIPGGSNSGIAIGE